MDNLNRKQRDVTDQPISGAYALAFGAVDAGVALVTGYPGSPATYVINALLELTAQEDVRIEWTSNEKVATEMAYGASLAGQRSLVCIKGVGLNIALDPLMAMNLSGSHAGFVVLVGDDPGGWGSQNEQDSRALATLTELPWLEPATVSDAHVAILEAFVLSEEISLPVIVRITRALALAEDSIKRLHVFTELKTARPHSFERDFTRWVVLPINVVPYHHRLLNRLRVVQSRFEESSLNGTEGNGSRGVITAGFAYQKLLDLLDGPIPSASRILRLGTLHPLPTETVNGFLKTVDSALVLEETAPVVERAVRAAAQSAGLTLPIFGRDTNHVPQVGELFASEVAGALDGYLPGLAIMGGGEQSRPRPSREPLCKGCPYAPTFDALTQTMQRRGGRDAFIIVGDPGCMVRAQMPPYHLFDVKHSLGSGIGMAAGIAASKTRADKEVIAICGDSGFLHSGFNGLLDAAHLGGRMLVLILDNETTALSGGQPHPGSDNNARGMPRRGVDLAALAKHAGAGMVRVVHLDRGEDMQTAIEAGIAFDGLAVVIAHGRCALY